MSLIPSLCLSEAGNATSISLPDNTGAYDVNDNPGGFGTPNPESSSITSVQQVFSFDDITGDIIVNYTIAPGSPTGAAVTAATKTDQLGNITDLDLATYNISEFPFPSDNPPVFPAEFFQPATTFADQYVTIAYTLSDGIETATNSQEFLLSSVSCCCAQKKWQKYALGKCSGQDAREVQTKLFALFGENAVGNIPAAKNELKLLKKLCADCGCGGGC